METTILCIYSDITPPSNKGKNYCRLIERILGTHYSLEFISSAETAFTRLAKDPAIHLVLLVTSGPSSRTGGHIVDTLREIKPDIRVIALDHSETKGRRISLMQRQNVWFYFNKESLWAPLGSLHFFRIVRALLEDPENEKWEFDFSVEDRRLNLRNHEFEIDVPITIKSRSQLNTLEACFKNPGQCVDTIEVVDSTIPGYSLAKVVKAVNDRVVKATGYCTWGILNSRSCADNAVKVLLGKKIPKPVQPVESTDFTAELYRVKKRLEILEQWLTLHTGNVAINSHSSGSYRKEQQYCFLKFVDHGG